MPEKYHNQSSLARTKCHSIVRVSIKQILNIRTNIVPRKEFNILNLLWRNNANQRARDSDCRSGPPTRARVSPHSLCSAIGYARKSDNLSRHSLPHRSGDEIPMRLIVFVEASQHGVLPCIKEGLREPIFHMTVAKNYVEPTGMSPPVHHPPAFHVVRLVGVRRPKGQIG